VFSQVKLSSKTLKRINYFFKNFIEEVQFWVLRGWLILFVFKFENFFNYSSKLRRRKNEVG